MNKNENTAIENNEQQNDASTITSSTETIENNILDSLLEMSDDLWDKINLPQSVWEDAFLLS